MKIKSNRILSPEWLLTISESKQQNVFPSTDRLSDFNGQNVQHWKKWSQRRKSHLGYSSISFQVLVSQSTTILSPQSITSMFSWRFYCSNARHSNICFIPGWFGFRFEHKTAWSDHRIADQKWKILLLFPQNSNFKKKKEKKKGNGNRPGRRKGQRIAVTARRLLIHPCMYI